MRPRVNGCGRTDERSKVSASNQLRSPVMRVVNRTAVSLVGARPFVEWTRSHDADANKGTLTVPRAKPFGTVVLLPEFELEEDVLGGGGRRRCARLVDDAREPHAVSEEVRHFREDADVVVAGVTRVVGGVAFLQRIEDVEGVRVVAARGVVGGFEDSVVVGVVWAAPPACRGVAVHAVLAVLAALRAAWSLSVRARPPLG